VELTHLFPGLELYNFDRFVSLFKFLYVILLLLFTFSTISMKLDPGIHIGMHLVCFSKTRCDKFKEGDKVLLYNSKFKTLGEGKLQSK
jgi:hypothetical protein